MFFLLLVLVSAGCGLALVLAASGTWRRYRDNSAKLSVFPEPPRLGPLSRHVGLLTSDEEGLVKVGSLLRQFSTVFVFWMGPIIPVINLIHPDCAKPILTANAAVAPKVKLFYDFMKPWLGEGLLISSGDRWFRNRRLLTPAFHYDVLRGYVSAFNETVATMHDKWSSLLADRDSVPLEMIASTRLMMLDSLLKCIFSYDSDCQNNESEYTEVIHRLTELLSQRDHCIWHYPDFIYGLTAQGREFKKGCAVAHKFSGDIIRRRREALNQRGEGGEGKGGTERKTNKMDFIDILLKAKDDEGAGLTDSEIQAEADTFMFAGHDTTSSALSWTLYNLATHPEMQQQCREEAQRVLGSRKQVAWEDLPLLTTITACIKESLRIHPPAQGTARVCTVDVKLPDGRVIPKGNICHVYFHGIHRNPAVWPDPDVFDPSRFSKENSATRHPLAFIPFSAGARNCIGQNFALAELKVCLATTLARFRLSVDPTRPASRLVRITLQSKGGIWLVIERAGESE